MKAVFGAVWLGAVLAATAPALGQTSAFSAIGLEDIYTQAAVQPREWRKEPSLLLFWDPDCPPCLAELKALPQIGRVMAGWQLATITVGDTARSRQRLGRLGLRTAEDRGGAQALAVTGSGAGVMRQLGNRDAALPFAAAVDAQGRLCATYKGALAAQVIAAIKARC